MSICKICASNGKPGVTILWDENIKSQKTGRLIPLESDRSFHKHYEPTKTAIPEPNDYPNPITAPVASKMAREKVPIVIGENAVSETAQTPIVDIDHLNMIKKIAAALQEYIEIKEHQQ